MIAIWFGPCQPPHDRASIWCMAKSHLPISPYVRLEAIQRLAELVDGGTMSVEQKVLAGKVFSAPALDAFRTQAIKEMVAAGYMNEEIYLIFANPESPYSILIRGLSPKKVGIRLSIIITKARRDLEKAGKEAVRQSYIHTQQRLEDAAWETIAQAGASHHKGLMEFIDSRSAAIAEAEGVRFQHAGRPASTKQTGTETKEDLGRMQKEAVQETEPEADDPGWEEEFTRDENQD